MAIELVKVELGARDVAGAQLADAIAVTDGNVSAALPGGLYRVKASTACVIRIGEGLTDATNGESWDAGEKEFREIDTGQVVAVDAA